MSERSYEELSALMDGETSELELRRTLKSLPDDPELVQKWRRYHMTRAVIQGELRDSRATQFASLDLTRAIAAQLENEPSHDVENMTSAQKSSWRDKIFKPLSNIAVAASVSASHRVRICRPTTIPLPMPHSPVRPVPREELDRLLYCPSSRDFK